MNKKLFAIDLDGTTLTWSYKISKENKIAINKVLNKNIDILIVTGRGPSRVEKIYKNLGISNYNFPVVCYNGAAVYDYKIKSFIKTELININDSKTILILANKYNISLWGYSDNNKDVYCSKKNNITRKVCLFLYRLNKIKFDENNFNENLVKISFSGTIKKTEKFINELKTLNIKIFKHVFFHTKQNLWDIVSKDTEKFSAIKWYINKNNIKLDDVIAIGDGENDIEMIKNVGFGIAMGNAIEKVKKHANVTTDSVNKNGLAKAINKFVLN